MLTVYKAESNQNPKSESLHRKTSRIAHDVLVQVVTCKLLYCTVQYCSLQYA